MRRGWIFKVNSDIRFMGTVGKVTPKILQVGPRKEFQPPGLPWLTALVCPPLGYRLSGSVMRMAEKEQRGD